MMAIRASDGFSRVVRMRYFRSGREGADDPTGLFVAARKRCDWFDDVLVREWFVRTSEPSLGARVVSCPKVIESRFSKHLPAAAARVVVDAVPPPRTSRSK